MQTQTAVFERAHLSTWACAVSATWRDLTSSCSSCSLTSRAAAASLVAASSCSRALETACNQQRQATHAAQRVRQRQAGAMLAGIGTGLVMATTHRPRHTPSKHAPANEASWYASSACLCASTAAARMASSICARSCCWPARLAASSPADDANVRRTRNISGPGEQPPYVCMCRAVGWSPKWTVTTPHTS